MELAMIGLGRMGGSMVQRLLGGGHTCVVFDSNPARVTALAHEGVTASHSLDELIQVLDTPRVVWLMPIACCRRCVISLAGHVERPADDASQRAGEAEG